MATAPTDQQPSSAPMAAATQAPDSSSDALGTSTFDGPAKPHTLTEAPGITPADQQPAPDAVAAADKPSTAPPSTDTQSKPITPPDQRPPSLVETHGPTDQQTPPETLAADRLSAASSDASTDTPAAAIAPTDRPSPKPATAPEAADAPLTAAPSKPAPEQPTNDTGEFDTNAFAQSRDATESGKTGRDDAATAEDPPQETDAHPPAREPDKPEIEGNAPTSPIEPTSTGLARVPEKDPAARDAPVPFQFTTDGQDIRDHIDSGYDIPRIIGDQPRVNPEDLPGEDAVAEEDDRKGKTKRINDVLARNVENIAKSAKKAADAADKIFPRPPTGTRSEVKLPQQKTDILTAKEPGIGDVVSATLVSSIFALELGRRAYGWLNKKEGREV
ncbi:hypothetical protein [Actinomadura sp. NBRC 104425]|uniref:hypothetical protein n=1 Tax=Actinomadura sp. NBRC 104425 TaxID=3032204 RepID=UPI0025570CEA|nr:hypothetical protein [Actinomadura sp. NBRC 104425]